MRTLRSWRREAERTPGPLIEWYGSGVLVSDPGDPPSECWRLLDALGHVGPDRVVLVSSGAYGHPAIAETVTAVCREAVARRPSPSALRLAFPAAGDPNGRYAGQLSALARSTGAAVVAADGPVTVLPGGTLYSGPAVGAWGWRAFDPDGTTSAVGHRCPAPDWEAALPADTQVVGGLVAEPAPAGLMVRDADRPRLTVDDPVLLIRVDRREPTLIVDVDGCPPASPAEVSVLFDTVERTTPVRVVAAPGRRPDRDWMAALGERFIVVPDPVTTTVPAPLPLSAQWQRLSFRVYRDAASHLVAEVLPGGILLRPQDTFTSDAVAWFEPRSGDVTVGTPGLPVPAAMVTALNRAWRPGRGRLQWAGRVGEPARSEMSARAGASGDLR